MPTVSPDDLMTPDDDVFLEDRERMKQFASHHLSPSPDHLDLPPDIVTALCSHHLRGEVYGDIPSVTLVESLALHADAVPDAYGEVESLGCSTIPTFSETDLQHHQKSDPVIGKVIRAGLQLSHTSNGEVIISENEVNI